MKKWNLQGFLASLLAVVLLTGPASAMSFPDVDGDSDYAAAVGYVSELGIMVGDTGGNFSPDKIVSRAEMAAIVCRVMNQTENLPITNVFTDVPAAHWANAYIGKASELKIVNGYGNGKFGISDPVTYEQAVTMIVRAVGEEDKANSYGGYPNGYLLASQENNLLEGIQAVQGQGLSRGSVAILLYNYYISQNTPSSPDVSHVHSWATRHIDEVSHYESTGTHKAVFKKCNCGFELSWEAGDSNAYEVWKRHNIDCGQRYLNWTEEVPNDPQLIIDEPAHDETYCTICGAIQ